MNVTTLDYSMRRRHPRVEMVGRVFVHNEEHLYIAPLHNISLGGIFIERVVTIDIGQEVKVVVKAPVLLNPFRRSDGLFVLNGVSELGRLSNFIG